MTASWSENSTCGQQLPRDPVTVGGSRCASRWQISAMSRVTGPFLVARTRGFGREEQARVRPPPHPPPGRVGGRGLLNGGPLRPRPPGHVEGGVAHSV
ncbi:unnamed protein product [Arctogadus glacialis]